MAHRTRPSRIRFRFVLLLIIVTRDELWTSAALVVDGLVAALRRFRKSHQLILAGPGGTQGICNANVVGSDASVSACCVRTTIVSNKGKGRDGMSLLESIIDS